jgi:hypothetical protein
MSSAARSSWPTRRWIACDRAGRRAHEAHRARSVERRSVELARLRPEREAIAREPHLEPGRVDGSAVHLQLGGQIGAGLIPHGDHHEGRRVVALGRVVPGLALLGTLQLLGRAAEQRARPVRREIAHEAFVRERHLFTGLRAEDVRLLAPRSEPQVVLALLVRRQREGRPLPAGRRDDVDAASPLGRGADRRSVAADAVERALLGGRDIVLVARAAVLVVAARLAFLVGRLRPLERHDPVAEGGHVEDEIVRGDEILRGATGEGPARDREGAESLRVRRRGAPVLEHEHRCAVGREARRDHARRRARELRHLRGRRSRGVRRRRGRVLAPGDERREAGEEARDTRGSAGAETGTLRAGGHAGR